MPVPRLAAASVTVPVAVQAVVPATVRRAVVRRPASAVAVVAAVAVRAAATAPADRFAGCTMEKGDALRRPFFYPRGLVGLSRLPKNTAFNSSRSVPCQYLRCAGSSANSTTLPCPCGDTTSQALPATRLRLASDR